MDLNQMSIQEKAGTLKNLVNKAKLDFNYAMQLPLGDDRDAKLAHMEILANNASLMFVGDYARVNQLDMDMRQDAFNTYTARLNEALSKFPEFSMTETQEEGRGTR